MYWHVRSFHHGRERQTDKDIRREKGKRERERRKERKRERKERKRERKRKKRKRDKERNERIPSLTLTSFFFPFLGKRLVVLLPPNLGIGVSLFFLQVWCQSFRFSVRLVSIGPPSMRGAGVFFFFLVKSNVIL